jgi:hypothetical protein
MAKVLRTPKSKERFEYSSAEEPSPSNLSRIYSAGKRNEEEQ